MTREETKAVFALLKTAYPAFYTRMSTSEMTTAIDLWWEMFAEDDVNIVKFALKQLLAEPRDFPPVIGTVKDKIRQIAKAAAGEPTDEKLWGILKKALGNSLYGAREEFEKLPPLLQTYCGSPSTLMDLARIDTETLDTVYHGQFLKQIVNIKVREETKQTMPEDVARLIRSMYTPLAEGNNGQNFLP